MSCHGRDVMEALREDSDNDKMMESDDDCDIYYETCNIGTIVFSLFTLSVNTISLIFSLEIYIIMRNNGDSNLTTNYLLAYIIPQTITIVLYNIHTWTYIILSVHNHCDISNIWKDHILIYSNIWKGGISEIECCLLILSGIVALIAIITYLISCVFAGYITYDFFANNNVVTYTYYGWMLGLVIVFIIVHFVPLAIAAILICILCCLLFAAGNPF
uniref:Uncharacterized protein n=1 Tax=Mimivirus LCMiAC01 TaxID=2506608 RepID=A0A481Z103_9VIRU|nr:MAG: hypothetical protein LCMiAC01_05230 [Mimivirus LCMiAC01]